MDHKHPPTRHHNYLRKIMDIPHQVFVPGKITHIDVQHEDFCDCMTGGYCNCDAKVAIVPDPPSSEVN